MSRRPIKPALEQQQPPQQQPQQPSLSLSSTAPEDKDAPGEEEILSPTSPTQFIPPITNKKRKTPASGGGGGAVGIGASSSSAAGGAVPGAPAKKPRTNTPWTAAEEQRLKTMRDAGSSWSEIAKTFPNRTEGSVKKHWYKDMHYAEFGEDESAALLSAIREYDANKWKVIGQKVGKPAKACEQYAKEHFSGK